MFTIKFLASKGDRGYEVNKTIKNIANYLKNDLNRRIKFLSDNSSIEIISGSPIENTGDMVVELLIKKRIVINNDDLNDKKNLDSCISEIKNFCDQASKIEDVSYIPLHFRKKRTTSSKDELGDKEE